MLITDIDIEQLTEYTAQISWTPIVGAGEWFTVFVDGLFSFRFQGTGEQTKRVNFDQRKPHSIAVVQHETETDDVPCPESRPLLRPSIRWQKREKANRYEVVQEVDGSEYVLHTQFAKEDDADILSYVFPVQENLSGIEILKARVYAYGSWGKGETPVVVSSVCVGLPHRIVLETVTSNSDGSLSLSLVSD